MEDTNERLYVRWTPEEDAILKQLVEEHGAANWPLLSTRIPGRSWKSCFHRWHNYLNPKVKHTKFTPMEDAVIVEEQAKHGNIWATIAERLPGRTDTAIRLRWNKHLSKKRYSGEFNVDKREAKRPYLDNNNDAFCLLTFMEHMIVNEVSCYIDKFQPQGGLHHGSTLRINTLPSTLLVTPSSTRIPPQDSAHMDKQSTSSVQSIENLVIIGSGPAGYSAAIHAARANLKPVVFEGFRVCGVPGGQLMATTEVKNFPGFPDGITESDLMDKMKRQAECWGAELYQEDVEFVNVTNRPFVVESSEHKVKCHSLIVATGATAKRLHLRRELEFWSRGISPCGVCDGASSTFKGQDLAVVGGGDTATGEALYLSEYARHVHLLVRRNRLRASKTMQDRVLNNPNITVHYNTETVDIVSNIKLQMAGVVVRNIHTNERSVLEAKGLFYGIGHMPNSQLLEYQINLDSSGYILVKEGAADTSVEGVFAAGDVQDYEWRQAITAAGLGCVAALSVESYLTIQNLLPEFHQPHTEEVEKELNDRDVQEKFDITLTKHKGQNAYLKLYHESPRLVCVLYTSPTCGPSRALKTILSKVIDEYDQNVHFVEIDIIEDPEVAEAAGIMGTPGVEFFKNRETLWIEPGVKTENDYREFIEAYK